MVESLHERSILSLTKDLFAGTDFRRGNNVSFFTKVSLTLPMVAVKGSLLSVPAASWGDANRLSVSAVAGRRYSAATLLHGFDFFFNIMVIRFLRLLL